MRRVRKGARRASTALSEIFSGCNCRSIQWSTPIAVTCWTSPGRGPNVSRLSACTARFCSVELASADLSFFLASSCGTATARLRHSRKGASAPNLNRVKLDLIMLSLLMLDLLRLDLLNTPERTESLDYEPSRGEKLLSDVVPEGLESHCRSRVSQGQECDGA